MNQVMKCKKPTVICFMGGDVDALEKADHIYTTTTLQEAGLLGAKLAGAKLSDIKSLISSEIKDLEDIAKELKTKLKPNQKYLRGLFTGGTLCYESQVIWQDLGKDHIYSNAPLDKKYQMPDSMKSD